MNFLCEPEVNYTHKAVMLYKDLINVDDITLEFSLKDCTIYYVPNMMHMHREVWVEENLIVFFPATYTEDFYDVLNRRTTPMQRLIFYPTYNKTIFDCFRLLIANYLVLDTNNITKEFIPEHFVIDNFKFLSLLMLA